MLKSVALCYLDDVPMRGALGFDPLKEGRDTIFVVNTVQGPVAYEDICPHYGSTSLPWRKNAYLNSSATKIVCGAHGAEFEINSGLCVSGPCLGQSLMTIALNVAEDGLIHAAVNQQENILE